MREIISSLDIGSCTMKLVVGEVYKNDVIILATSKVKSKGVKKGIIVNPEEAIISLKELFYRCEEVLNTKIDKVIINVPSYYSEFIKSEGKTTITNEEGVIETHDMVRCMQGCVYNKIPANKELVAIMPLYFLLDEENKVVDPKGMKTSKLECTSVISLVPKKNVYTIFSVLESMGVEVIDISFGAISDYFEYKNNSIENLVGAVVNIGKDKTEVSVINKGILIQNEILDIGSRNVDADISYAFNISVKTASKLKERFALSHKRNASTSWSEEVLSKNEDSVKINQYEISEIVYSRVKEILELSKKQINLLTKKEISYIIVSGGLTEANDFDLVVQEIFNKEVYVKRNKEIGCRHNEYSSAVGLIRYYHDKLAFRNKLSYTIDESKQSEMLNIKNKNNGNILGKIYGYFFNN